MESKSYESIMMDFRKAKQQAERLDQLSRRMKNLAERQFENTIRSVDQNWEGDHADAYIGKCRTLKENMLRSAGNLSAAADAIRAVSENLYEAEMRAWRIAHERSR